MRACNLTKVRIIRNIISYDISQITKTEARKSEVMGLCDKYRDVDLLAEIETMQDRVGSKKAAFSFNIPENILKKEFL